LSKRRNRTNRARAAVGLSYYAPQFRAKKKPREVRTLSGNCKKETTDIISRDQEENNHEIPM